MQAHWTRWPLECWSSGSTKPQDYSPTALTPQRLTRPLSGWDITQLLTTLTSRSLAHALPTQSPPKTSIGPYRPLPVTSNRYHQLSRPSRTLGNGHISVSEMAKV